MSTKKQSIIFNKQGVSLIYAMLVLIVMSILGVAIFTLFASNLKQAKFQEDNMRSHFVAVAGVEVTFAALLDNEQSLLKNYFDKNNTLSDTITFSVDADEDGIQKEVAGTAIIEVRSYLDEDDYRLVNIKSIGQAVGANASKTVNMYFRYEYPEIQTWN